MKFIKSRNFLTSLFLLGALLGQSQEIIQEAPSTPVKKDTIKKSNRQKIDGIIAAVGDYIILDSDIDLAYIELAQQGASAADIPRCQVLGSLLEDKLYAHQATQDSTIVVTDAEINAMMNEKIGVMMEQIGGDMKKILKFYNKKNEEEFRSFFFDVLKNNKLTTEMRNKIIEDIEITPEEVRTFFKKIPQEDLPTFGAEMEVSQIIIQPKVSEAEKQKVIDRLNEIRREVLEEGASFTSRAVIYTQDRASSSNGGFYKINRKTPFLKEFKDVAFSLNEGEISKPFETEYGYHIILLERIKGQELELRHILLTPKVTDEALKEARDKITLIRNRIMEGEISFADAARTMSDEKETRANGGVFLNPRTLDSKFELTKMDPTLYNQVSNLKDKEISLPILEEDKLGQKQYKIITVTNRIDEHVAEYSKDYIKIKELALSEKRLIEIDKWTKEKIGETFIKVNGSYRNCDFVNGWVK
ncbi:peptidylprolyl isomerase [Flavobacterium orientale]|uniref:peptidylprolyl isomerase n=1 Tax=Flavobacterium orientale TaxID=1756020 RepID=UPI001E5F4D19|nr:peptidylprolyl isomerase [Flavobacterium orientale]